MTSHPHPPEWRKAWKVDDPAWMKRRRAEWKDIKGKLDVVGWFLDKAAKATIKNYFMTGCGYKDEPSKNEWDELNYNPDNPLYNVTSAMLFEYWLHPDRSEDNWKNIGYRYVPFEGLRADGTISPFHGSFASSRARFRGLISEMFPPSGDLFCGLEERMYRVFTPIRCRPVDYPELDERGYQQKCWSVYASLGKAIMDYLNEGDFNPESIAPVLVSEYCDAIPGAYQFKMRQCDELNDKKHLRFILEQDIGGDIVRGYNVIKRHDAFDPRQVSVAREMLARLSGMDLPEDVQTFAEPYLDVDFSLPEDDSNG